MSDREVVEDPFAHLKQRRTTSAAFGVRLFERVVVSRAAGRRVLLVR